MRTVFKGIIVSVALVTAATVGRLTDTVVSGAGADPQSQSPPAARRAATAEPNLNGLWQAITTANWDIQDHNSRPGPPQFGAMFSEPPGQGIVEGNEIPYQPWALEQKKKNFAERFTADPEAKCYLPGVPRATYMPFPFQIVQSRDYILIAYGYANAVRTIHMNKPNPNPVDVAVDTWMGYSGGGFEGQTLVVDATSFNDESWFDRAGNFHSNALKVVERYTPVGKDLINYEATMEDPKVFTRPWKISLPLYRVQGKSAELLPYNCVEYAEELLYGHLRKPGTTTR